MRIGGGLLSDGRTETSAHRKVNSCQRLAGAGKIAVTTTRISECHWLAGGYGDDYTPNPRAPEF